jgi:glycosyltransferase involved in cell wall biosynthesis
MSSKGNQNGQSMKNVDISVVVCTYNRAHILGKALSHLVPQETDGRFSYEIVVVDDSSTDSTSEVVAQIAGSCSIPVRYIRSEGQGIAHARNSGIAGSLGEWIAFIDDDEFADSNWLKELLACANETGRQVIGGAVRLCLSDDEVSQMSPVCRLMLGESLGRTKVEKCSRKFSPGCLNLLVKATVFDAVGRFDESLTRGGEDTEFGIRIRRAGIEAWFTPRAVVGHHIPAYRLKENYLFWSSLRCGGCFAYRDYREWGLAKTELACLARIAQAFLINIPRLVWACLWNDKAEIVGRKCRLLQALGYVRQLLFFLSFTQERYFAGLTFRNERSIFAANSDSSRSPERKSSALG